MKFLNLFRKERYKETPEDEMKCECGFPFPLKLRIFSGLTYRRITEKHEDKCRECGRNNTYYC